MRQWGLKTAHSVFAGEEDLVASPYNILHSSLAGCQSTFP